MGGRSGVDNCLICFENFKGSRKGAKLSSELGCGSGDVFEKVCELLQISYQEIRHDWNFEGGSSGIPFCASCCEGLTLLVKLRKQLADINCQIDEQIKLVQDKIRRSDKAVLALGDRKTILFREKACQTESRVEAQASDSQHISTQNSTHSEVTHLSWSVPDHANSYPVVEQPVIPDYEQNDDFHEPFSYPSNPSDDTQQDAQPPEPPKTRKTRKRASASSQPSLPSITRKVTVSEVFPFLPPPPPRTNPYSSATRAPETFSPIITTSSGMMTYEGIQILQVPSGYQCGQCLAIIGKDHSGVSLRKAKIHMKGYHLGGYKCHLCQTIVTSNDILLQHLNRSHTPKPTAPCPICGRHTAYSAMKIHQFTHMNAEEKAFALASGFKPSPPKQLKAKYTCKICGKMNFGLSYLRQHELTHVEAKFRKDFKCPHCPKTFTHKRSMEEHIEAIHNELTLMKQLCHICNKSIPVLSFNPHMKLHAKGRCRHCGRSFRNSKLDAHEKRCEQVSVASGGRPFECKLCIPPVSFRTFLHLRHHQRKLHLEAFMATRYEKRRELVTDLESGKPIVPRIPGRKPRRRRKDPEKAAKAEVRRKRRKIVVECEEKDEVQVKAERLEGNDCYVVGGEEDYTLEDAEILEELFQDE